MGRQQHRFRTRQRPRGAWCFRQNGFVLITSYMVVAVLLVFQTAYVSRIVEDQKMAGRYVQTIAAMHYAEAGLDQAIASLRADPNYAGTSGATIALGNGAFAIAITPYAGDTTLRRVAVQGYDSSSAIANTVNAIVRVAGSLFNWGIFGVTGVSGSGNARVNGYDSAAGVYGGSNIVTNVDAIATNGTGIGSIALTGNVNVGSGSLACGAGCTPATAILTGSHVTYGSETSLASSPSFSLVVAPPLPPGYVVAPVTLSGNTVVTLTTSHPAVFVTSTGRYAYVVSSLAISGNARLMVNASGAPIDIYVQGNVALSGNARVGNQTWGGAATQVTLYQTVSSVVNISGNAAVTGAIYAPSSQVIMSGNAADYGAVIANVTTLSGNAAVHYDSALGDGSSNGSETTLVEWNL